MKRLFTLLLITSLLASCRSFNQPSIDPINQLPLMLGRNIDYVSQTFTDAGYTAFGIVAESSSAQEVCFARTSNEIVWPKCNEQEIVEKIATLFIVNTEDSKHLESILKTYDQLLKSSYEAQLTSAYIKMDGIEVAYKSVDEVVEALQDVDFEAVNSAGVIYSAIVDGENRTLEVPYFKATFYGASGSPTTSFYSGIWFKI